MRAGVDVGASKTLAVLCADDGTVLREAQRPTPAGDGGKVILDTAAAVVRTLLGETPVTELAGVGVGAAGVIEPESGLVLATGNLFTGWAGTAINAGLAARLGGVPVRAENDVNGFLFGELAALGKPSTGGEPAACGERGAAGPPRNALAVALGTGVGGALWVDGRLLHGGATGAGEIGHIGDFGQELCSCGQRGHLEAYASGKSLARRYAQATGAAPLTAAQVATAARSGDPAAIEVFEQAGRCLGTAIAQAGGLLGVDIAILGGGVLRSWPLLEKALLRAVRAQPLLSGEPVIVHRSRLGSRAVAIGAAGLIPV
jgi:glucokinase